MEMRELIAREIERVPDPYLVEVLDFIKYIERKVVKEGMETYIASESSLKKDWLSTEEDEAWADL